MSECKHEHMSASVCMECGEQESGITISRELIKSAIHHYTYLIDSNAHTHKESTGSLADLKRERAELKAALAISSA